MKLSRRHVLRGAGVALALPWLESLAPRPARGQAAAPRRRFVAMYFPLGNRYLAQPDFWTPKATGDGDAWQLSPILESLAPVKQQTTVLTNVGQTAFGATEAVLPGNGLLTGSFLTCTKLPIGTANDPRNGVSIEQRIAGALGVRSLQVGLSTLDSSCDGSPCAYSRSVSWSADGPLYKSISPQTVFDYIVASGLPSATPTPPRDNGRKSVLDFVLANANGLRPRLGAGDRARVDQFLTSVRDLETRIGMMTPGAACQVPPRPSLTASITSVPPDYDRDAHANLMIDLVVMALSCDVMPVVSFMLDDARSSFPYTFVPRRHFTDAGTTLTGTNVNTSPIGAANAAPDFDVWASIDWWFASKASALCQKLAAIPDGAGATLLDNSVVWFGSGQQGEDVVVHLPVLYVGGGGGVLRTNRSVAFSPGQRLSNVYLTFLTKVFGVNAATFGDSTGVIPDLLA
jgi:hypothetical protein